MPYEVEFSKRAAKDYDSLDRQTRERIDRKLEYLRATPRGADTKKLVGTKKELYRARVGTYRIIYQINDQILRVYILNIDPRDAVYR